LEQGEKYLLGSCDYPMMPSTSRTFVAASLGAALLSPLFYFGCQIAAAPFYPGYSFMSQAASLLGSPNSTRPWIFNLGAVLTGLSAVLAAPGLLIAMRQVGTNTMLASLTAIAVISLGVASAEAGFFPLPSPRHNTGLIGAGMFALPAILVIAFWSQQNASSFKIYLLANLFVLIAMVPIMSGKTSLDFHAYGGLFQRIFALTVFPAIAIVAGFLLRRLIVKRQIDAD
jgi:hypothetical membrane protein